MQESAKRIDVLKTVPRSVRKAIRGMLNEERRRRIHEGYDLMDTNHAHKRSIARLDNGTLSECACCAGIIPIERVFSEDALFTITCDDKCSYTLVMEALEKKITDTSLSLAPKGVSAMQDLNSNEAAKGDHADAFTSQDINVQVLQTTQKLMERLRERKAFLVLNPGYFNVCALCGNDIPIDRLLNSPESGLCRKCKPNTRNTSTNGRSSILKIVVT